MDIDLLRTFLEVHRTRHFGRAADRLFITQSAVSARIRLLEDDLGAALFTRARNNIDLTPAGRRFLRHAESILNAWNRARQDTLLAEADRVPLAVGGTFSLWDIVLQEWISVLATRLPNVSLLAEAHGAEPLLRRVLDGYLDIGFLFEPPAIDEVVVREVGNIDLVLVSTQARRGVEEAMGEGYVLVDWGPSFAAAHARHFPGAPTPRLRAGLGRIGLNHLLRAGGAAYLAEQMVRDLVQSRRLYVVADAPRIERRAYAVHLDGLERRPLIDEVLALMPSLAARGKTEKAGRGPVAS